MASIIFYGAGQNLFRNLNRWCESGLQPVCIVDANTALHHTVYSTPGGEIKILPLLEAIDKFPDYQLFLTQHLDNLSPVVYHLLSIGVPIERIRTCDSHDDKVNANVSGLIGTSIYPKRSH